MLRVNIPRTDLKLQALRANGISIVAMHHHMIGTSPNVTFFIYWARGNAQNLAAGVRGAVNLLAKPVP